MLRPTCSREWPRMCGNCTGNFISLPLTLPCLHVPGAWCKTGSVHVCGLFWLLLDHPSWWGLAFQPRYIFRTGTLLFLWGGGWWDMRFVSENLDLGGGSAWSAGSESVWQTSPARELNKGPSIGKDQVSLEKASQKPQMEMWVKIKLRSNMN